MKRTTMLTSALIGGLLATLTLAAPAPTPSDDGAATDIAAAFLREYHDQIVPLPGSTSSRAAFIREGLALLERAGAPSDPEHLLDLAEGYVRIADVSAGLRTAHPGDLDAALALLDRADAIRADAEARLTGPTTRSLRTHARASMLRGDMLRDQERNPESLAAYRDALASLAAIAPAESAAEPVVLERAVVQIALADQLRRSGDPEREREALLTGAIEVLTAGGEPATDLSAQWALARAHAHLGEYRVADAGDPTRGLQSLESATTLWLAVLAELPSNTFLRTDLAGSEYWRGVALNRLDRADDAMVAWSEAARHFAFLREADPTDRRALIGMASIHEAVGSAIRRADPGGAIQQYAEAVRLLEPFTQANPTDLRAARTLGLCQYLFARTTMDLATPDTLAAAASAAAAYRTLERVDIAAPGDEAFTRKRIVDAAQVWLVAINLGEEPLPAETDRDAVAAIINATIARWTEAPGTGIPAPQSQSEALRRLQDLASKLVTVKIEPAPAPAGEPHAK